MHSFIDIFGDPTIATEALHFDSLYKLSYPHLCLCDDAIDVLSTKQGLEKGMRLGCSID